MEYIKLLIPFIVGVLTTPVVEGIKSSLLFQKKEKLVMTELADLLEDVSYNINEVMSFLQNVAGNAYEYKYISAEQLFSPKIINIMFLRDSLDEFYIRSPKNSRMAIKKIFKGAERLKEHQQVIIDSKQESLKEFKVHTMRSLWVLYYNYLSCACNLKEDMKEFVFNERVVASDCNESVEKECLERGFDYHYLYNNFTRAKELKKGLRERG